MGNLHKSIDPSLRSRADYYEAKSLFEDKRDTLARVGEIDRALRTLRSENPEAVEAARADVPFRRSHGCHSQKNTGLTNFSIVMPIRDLPDMTG